MTKMNASDNSSYFYNIITLALAVLTLIPTIIALLSLFLFKKKKSKEDMMYLQKLSIKILLYVSYSIIFIFNLIAEEYEDKGLINIVSQIQMLIFSMCLISLWFIDLKINYEKYMKYYDPTFVISDFINRRAKNVSYEIFYATFTVFISIISYNYFNYDYLLGKSTDSINDLITQKYFISCLILVYPIILILTIVSFILKIKQLKIMTSIAQDYRYNSLIKKDIKLKKKVELSETIFIIFNFLYSISSILLSYLIYNFMLDNKNNDFENEYNYQLKILSLFFVIINFLEAVFFMFYISRTDFYKFTLGNTEFAKIYSLFHPEVVEKPTISIDSSFNNFNTNNFYKERAKELNSTCMFFHNNLSYSMDEIFVNMFDNTINIVFSAITKIFSDKAKNAHFKISKSANNLNNHPNRLENNNNNNSFNYNNNFLNDVQNKNGFYSEEEEYDSDTEKRKINSKSLNENPKGVLISNTNENLNFKETDFKTSLISEEQKEKEKQLKPLLNKRKSNKGKSRTYTNYIKHHEILISENHNDLKDERLLKLININAEKEHLQFHNAYSNDPTYQRLQDDNFNNATFESFSKNKQFKKNLKGDITSPRDESLNYLISGMNLNIEVKEYYEKEFQDIMSLKNINYSQLETSFMSHYNQQQNNFNSLFSNNAKEELFKKQKNLVIRTKDKLYNFEFLTNCEENLNEDNSESGNLFRYTSYLKEHEFTFLPYIVGVFKIKINNLRELKIVISKNNLIDEIPKENFNYWQLIRIKEKDSFQMITSSKDRQSLLVSDEILIKDDTKFNMINHNDFCKILFSDLDFLRRINATSYSLLIMYYEMGKNTANNSQNSVSDEDNKNFREKYGRMSNTSNNGMNSTNNNISAIRPFGEPSAFDFSIKNDLNLIRIVNGFQSNVNEFRCVLFFMFDNIFKSERFYYLKNLCSSNHEKFQIMIRNKFNEIKD